VTQSAAGQVLDDLLRDDLRIVFCGTQAGTVSARKRAYYAGPGNRFWQTLFDIGLVPNVLQPWDYPRLLDHGIGLTDMAKTTCGPDSSLRPAHFDPEGFETKVLRFSPRLIAFNGKRAASAALGVTTHSLHYGLQARRIGRARLCVLPSTSGAARAFWSIAPWQDAAAYAREVA
jgi:TDG/mug DNA glycosylase family protein